MAKVTPEDAGCQMLDAGWWMPDAGYGILLTLVPSGHLVGSTMQTGNHHTRRSVGTLCGYTRMEGICVRGGSGYPAGAGATRSTSVQPDP